MGYSGAVLEDWEGRMAWHPWNGRVTLGPTAERVTQGARALRVNYDLGQWARPTVFASLPVKWNLANVPAVALDVFVPDDAKGTLSLALALTGTDRHAAPVVPLKPGWNTVREPLDGAWLPAAERAGISEVEWVLTGNDPTASGWVAFDNLRADRR